MKKVYSNFNKKKQFNPYEIVFLCSKCNSDQVLYKKDIIDPTAKRWYSCKTCKKLQHEEELIKCTAEKAKFLVGKTKLYKEIQSKSDIKKLKILKYFEKKQAGENPKAIGVIKHKVKNKLIRSKPRKQK